MSKKTVTTQTNQYTPQATTAQNTLSSTYNPMVANPYSGKAYNMGLQQNMQTANQLSANATRNAMQSFQMSGMGNLTGGARASLLSGLGRSASGLRQQGFFNNWNTATANQQFGASVLGQQSGQLSGTTGTQKTSGLGTWLPQVAGAALGIAGGFASGGASGGLSGTAGAWNAATSPMQAGSSLGNNNPSPSGIGQFSPTVPNPTPGQFPWQVNF
jgi:hypothetical protein